MFRISTTIFVLLFSTRTLTLGAMFKPSTSEELVKAIADARAGDVIQLLPQKYEGNFVLGPKEGDAPVILTGTPQQSPFNNKETVIVSRAGKTFIISGGHWDLQKLVIHSSEDGIEVKGSGNKVNFLVINAAKRAVVVEGDDNVVKSIVINGGSHGIIVKGARTQVRSISLQGVRDEGIVVESGSSRSELHSLSCQMATDQGHSLILQSHTTQIDVKSSTFNGIADISSYGSEFKACVFAYVNLDGCGNLFKSATIRSLYIAARCGTNENNFQSTVYMLADQPIH